MTTATALRLQIEHALEHRFPAALSPAPRAIHEIAPTGLAVVDELLYGGLPVGAISELTGPSSSGRTTLALQFVAHRTAEARPCAWVDVGDAFNPESAAASGVRLMRLLWVRCREEALKSAHRTGRLRIRTSHRRDSSQRSSWTRLDQGLRATDLLLQAGGFAGIVLDLGDLAPEQANRIPAATWFRYRQAAERTQCSLIVLGKRAYAQSAAAVVLECAAKLAVQTSGPVLRGLQFTVQRRRERHALVEITTRKPVASTWQANTAWDQVVRA